MKKVLFKSILTKLHHQIKHLLGQKSKAQDQIIQAVHYKYLSTENI